MGSGGGYNIIVRPVFAAVTILAAFLAVTLVAARHDARYSTAQAVRDLSAGRLPDYSLSTDSQRLDLSKVFSRCAPTIRTDVVLEIAVAEIEAANALPGGAQEIDARFEGLALEHVDIPLVQYRSAGHFLGRLQEAVKAGGKSRGTAGGAGEFAATARRHLLAAIDRDGENSVYYYEMAYSYLAEGDTGKAAQWFGEGRRASRFAAGDEQILSGCERLSTIAEIPMLEKMLVLYQACRPEAGTAGLAFRMEALVSGLLADAQRRKAYDSDGYSTLMLGVEDLAAKLLQNAKVLRQAQAALVAEGLMWRQAARDGVRENDEGLLAEARKRLVEASYRYVLVGWLRARAGLLPQQAIVELDTPLDLRLDFSGIMQGTARVLLLATIVLLGAAVIARALAVRLACFRQPALALVTLAAFTFLAYGGCFLSLAGERARVQDGVTRRLKVALEAPRYLREHGQPSSAAEYDVAATREMLGCFEYTLQASRVLAYVGTRECFDTLIEALDSPKIGTPWDVAVVLQEATGLDFGYRVSGSKAANYEAIRAWREWWKVNRDRFPEKPSAGELAEGNRRQDDSAGVRTR